MVQPSRYDIIKIRPINYHGIVTGHNQTVYFYNIYDADKQIYEVSLDNPSINRHFIVNFADILTITSHTTHEIIYKKSPDDNI